MTDANNQTNEELKAAHHGSSHNRVALERGETAGCFYCLRVFDSHEIKEWVDLEGDTALCPYCGIDSVLGASYGYPITGEFLKLMHAYWFGRTRVIKNDATSWDKQ